MTQNRRLLAGVAILVVLAAAVLAAEYFRGQSPFGPAAGDITLEPGSVPIYYNGKLVAGLVPAALDQLEPASFIDAEDAVLQDGWLLKDVLLLYFDEDNLAPGTAIRVSSSSRDKSVDLTWAEAAEEENMVMFDLSNRGTLKLVSLLEKLDVRAEWIQDVDRIEVGTR